MVDQELRKIIGILSQEIFPNTGYCYECGISWRLVEGKVVNVTRRNGLFAVCELCWGNLNLSVLIIHYTDLYESWETKPDGYTLEKVVKAVEIEYNKNKPND